MDGTTFAHKLAVTIGILSALSGAWLLTTPVLLDPDEVAELGPRLEDPAVLAILVKGSIQIAGLSLGWGLLVVGLAGPALLRGDRLAYAMLWFGGVGGAVIASWPTLALGMVEAAMAFAVPLALAVSLAIGWKSTGSGLPRDPLNIREREAERR